MCLNSDIFSFCSNHSPQIRSVRLSSVSSTSALSAARCGGELLAARRSSPFDGRPSRVCSGAELLLLLAAASTTAALLLLPAVTLHRPAPRRDQARRRPATRPPAPLRVQVQHAHPPPVAPAEPLGLKAPTAASRSPMHAALARSPEPAPAGGRARCWPRPPTAGQLSGRARGAERLPAAQRRPKKKLGLMGHRESQIRHGGRHQSVLRGKPFL